MERSWHYKDVDNYDLLARYYDELLQDEESLKYWLEYFEKLPGKDILELASGSGVMARILKSKGYNVIASDLSSAMRDVALKTNFDGDYRILNMIDFEIDQSFDIILCLCDSINYLFLNELETMFENVYNHLNLGGHFVFDMHDLMRLEEFANEYIEEGQVLDTFYQWAIISDPLSKELQERFTFYTEEGIIQEHHLQNVFTIQEVEKALSKVGFKVQVVDEFIKDEKVLVIGEKI